MERERKKINFLIFHEICIFSLIPLIIYTYDKYDIYFIYLDLNIQLMHSSS